VQWDIVCRPKALGGLGVHDLRTFGRALRLRWLWTAWRHPERPWVGTPVPCDKLDRALFGAATQITIGNEAIANFWSHIWLCGWAPCDQPPSLFAISSRKRQTVREAFCNYKWISDIRLGLQPNMLDELTRLASLLDEGVLDEG
jgi:hypothetical protein